MSRRGQRGVVTAELAVGMPILLAVTASMAWLLAVGVGQVRTVDAARETARALARGDDETAAVALGEQVAPEGVRLTVSRTGARIVVRASGRIPGPGGLFAGLPGARLQAEAVAAVEQAGAGP